MPDRHNPTAPLAPATSVRRLVRRSRKAVLATLRPPDARPFASLVLVAADPGAHPLLLLSKLAVHTRNLAADQRASLLFDGTGSAGDPLTGPRVTLEGRVVRAPEEAVRTRFLRRHPDAEGYAGFADFDFHRLEVERAHLIEGFGRIVEVAPNALAAGLPPSGSAHWHGEAASIADLNVQLEQSGSPCRITGLDPEGFDLSCDGRCEWLEFSSTAGDVVSAAHATARALIEKGLLPRGAKTSL